MLRTNVIIADLKDIPIMWVFEYYLRLPEKLMGQNMLILSVFNPKDTKPSLSIFMSNRGVKQYKFKDFSTGINGDYLTLVEKMFNLSSRGEAAHKIIKDYKAWINNNKSDYANRKLILNARYKLDKFIKRDWNTQDKRYWTHYNIGSKLLEKYQVFPLESYTMNRENDGILEEVHIDSRPYIYGYFRIDGSLYKIYQPKLIDNKFIKVKDYIQGTDQLTYQGNNLIICSSLKDCLAMKLLNYKGVEVVAPDSENKIIPENVIASYKIKYKNIITLFDYDPAGIKAMASYKESYGIPNIILPMSKDLSDSVKDFGITEVRTVLTPLIKEIINES